jgi:hypothetical protein
VNPLGALRRSTRSRLAPGGLVVAVIAILAGACASVPPGPAALGTGDARVREFSFHRDTFAFPNDIRAFYPERDDLYANHCFVLARGMRQFFRFARFDPAAARLDHAGYVDRVRRVVARPPWHPPIPAAERVVIPGYASLREFSRAEASAVKEGLGGRFWTLVHWTNWRVVFPMSRRHQANVLEEIRSELAAGRLVQLLVTNWPIPELNHTVVAFASRVNARGVELAIWDPNEPARPGTITFDSTRGEFWATRVYATRPGAIRVFRMYYSALL